MSNCRTGQKHKNPVLSSEQEQDETGARRGETQLWAPFHYSKLKIQTLNQNICFPRRDWPLSCRDATEVSVGASWRGRQQKVNFWALCCGSLWPVLSTHQPGLCLATSEWNHIREHWKMQNHQIRHAANVCASAKGLKGTSLTQPCWLLPLSCGSIPFPAQACASKGETLKLRGHRNGLVVVAGSPALLRVIHMLKVRVTVYTQDFTTEKPTGDENPGCQGETKDDSSFWHVSTQICTYTWNENP